MARRGTEKVKGRQRSGRGGCLPHWTNYFSLRRGIVPLPFLPPRSPGYPRSPRASGPEASGWRRAGGMLVGPNSGPPQAALRATPGLGGPFAPVDMLPAEARRARREGRPAGRRQGQPRLREARRAQVGLLRANRSSRHLSPSDQSATSATCANWPPRTPFIAP